jgi:uncharacterized DUF497 family protein
LGLCHETQIVRTICVVFVSFDGAKDKINRRKHGISLERAADFDFGSCLYILDDRMDYGETRYIAVGFIGQKLHVLAYVPPGENALRAITLRKADTREMRKYDEET